MTSMKEDIPNKLYQLGSSAKIISCLSMAPHEMPLIKSMNADTYRLTNGTCSDLPKSHEFRVFFVCDSNRIVDVGASWYYGNKFIHLDMNRKECYE